MSKINLTAAGGDGPYTITVREVSESSGNRYIGPNPTNTLTNLDVNLIKDGTTHLYSVLISNSTCSNATQAFEMNCPCETVPSFVASQSCINPADPKIAVTATIDSGFGDGGVVRIKILTLGDTVVHDITSLSGTQFFSVNNNQSYRIVVSSGYAGFGSCKAPDQIIAVACAVECNLSLTVYDPSC